MSKASLHSPLITTRIGITFAAVCSVIGSCAIAGAFSGFEPRFHSLLWIFSLAACTLGGVVAMNGARTLRLIESELRRTSGESDPQPSEQSFSAMRPIIGPDPVNQNWNDMIDRLSSTIQDEAPQRSAATLDQEVITLARAMRGLPIAWAITENDGSLRLLGPAARGILGLPDQEDLNGKNIVDLLGIDGVLESDAITQLLSPVRMVMQNRRIEFEDHSIDVRIMRSRLAGRSGDSEGLAWVLSDVTQQRAATEARDQFLMTATHELRTPLTNLQAYAEALIAEEDLAVEAQKEFCNTINSEAIRLSRLVDQLLTVSQMEAGSMTINRHELDILPILEQVVEQTRGQAEQKQMRLTPQFAAKLPTVFGDRDKLQAALVNLVGNAIKYTPENGEVSVRCASDDGLVRIVVEDTGPGIAVDEQEKIFEKFYRAADVTDSEHRGNGLGLAFAREIARLHGGDIELESELGQGSTFTLRIPIGGSSRSGV